MRGMRVSCTPSVFLNPYYKPLSNCKLLLLSDWCTDAKKEIEKHMGGAVLDADQQNPSLIKRSRQPGILGYY